MNQKLYLPLLKKLAAAIVFALILVSGFGQPYTTIVWSEPTEVAPSSFGASSPKLALLPGGVPVAVWGKSGTSPKIYFSRMSSGSFEAPVQLSTGSIPPDIYGFGGLDLAVSGNRIYVVFENFDAGVHLLRSEDGGQTFLPETTVFDPPASDFTTLASLAVDQGGNPLVSVIRELASETQARYITVRSEDGGLTFLPPVVASEPAAGEFVCECCPSDLLVSGDSVWLVFRNNNNNLRDIWVSRSTDHAASFDAACDVDNTDWMVNACPISGPRLQRLANDSLLAVWMSGATGQGRIYGATLHSGTMSKGWQFGFPATNASGLQAFPSIAGTGDTLCVVWEETGFGANATDLLFDFSTGGASGLSTLPTNLTQAPGSQKYPSLIYGDGVFHLLYQSGGALEYRTGTISEVSPVVETGPSGPLFELLSNPAQGFISVKTLAPSPLRFRLVSTDGQVVQEWPSASTFSSETIQLPLNGVVAGLYFLEGETDGEIWAVKVVVR
ncbi:MAG: T9SS type A sorting domain-containing protein [Bacteroidetes bacterium]|nr:T9SS type A sorting domain-containing protein [Bacteroidota bacterium]